MKKKLIAAGAASLAVAAMPVVGVFATPVTGPTTYTDVLKITIDKTCAFGYQNDISSGDGAIDVTGITRTAGAKASLTETATTKAIGTFSETMVNGTIDTSVGTTKLGVYCNSNDGYSITSKLVGATPNVSGDPTIDATDNSGNLVATGNSKSIPISATMESGTTSAWSYKIAASPAQGQTDNIGQLAVSSGTWLGSPTSPATTTTLVTAPQNAPKMTTNKGDYFTITYGVRIDQTQPADTYTGGIQYILTDLGA